MIAHHDAAGVPYDSHVLFPFSLPTKASRSAVELLQCGKITPRANPVDAQIADWYLSANVRHLSNKQVSSLTSYCAVDSSLTKCPEATLITHTRYALRASSFSGNEAATCGVFSVALSRQNWFASDELILDHSCS
jgi:hypothetical protein